MKATYAVTAFKLIRSIRCATFSMQRFGVLSASLAASLVAFVPSEDVRAVTIATGAGCTLVDAIESANTNAAVGGCAAGAVGQDTVIVNQNVILTTVNNGAGSTANGLPVITEDLVIRSPAPGVMVTIERDRGVGIPEFRILEIGGNAPSVTLRDLSLRFGHVLGSPPVAGVPVPAAGGCIKMGAGHLTIVDSLIEECKAQGASSAIAAGGDGSGGAVFAANGSLTVRNTTFSFNDARGGEATGGGFAGGKGEGGAIFATSITLKMVDSTVAGSQALGGNGANTAGIGKGGGMALYNSDGTISGSRLLANASSGGLATNGSSALSVGGGLVVEASTMTFDSTEVGQNVASGKDSLTGIGGYAYGGGLYSGGSTLEFRNATVWDNRANGGNGSVGNSNGLARGGGLYLQDTTATIKSTAIEANSAIGARARGGGIYENNTDPSATPLEIHNSTLDGNVVEATFNVSRGGGLYQDVGTTKVRNSTFSHNTADDGGAVAVEGGVPVAGITVDIANVTVSGNAANQHGGGFYVAGSPSDPNRARVSLHNTTVTNNTNDGVHLVHVVTDPELVSGNTIIGAQASGVDCSVDGGATLTSRGGNLETGTSCGFTDATDSQSVSDLGVDALSDYGGSTLTHALLPYSPAIEAGKKAICNQEANKMDQRGFSRFYDGAGDGTFHCDSGSVEYQGLLANPGFEDRLDPANDWTLVASGGGDDRQRTGNAPSGRQVFVFQANGALENVSQDAASEGSAGDVYTLTLLAAGQGLTVGESMTITIEAKNGGTTLDTQTCTFNWTASNFSFRARRCALTTTAGAHDSIGVTVGWDGASTGTLIIDAVSLTK